MEPILQFIGSYWWLVFVFGGVGAGWLRSISAANERRRQHQLELERIRHGVATTPRGATEAETAQAQGGQSAAQDPVPAQERVESEHQDINARWLSYELDLGRLIDFPSMTDVREPLTADYLRAKRKADSLAPEAGVVLEGGQLRAYAAAVSEFAHAFELAERNAYRVRDTAYSDQERVRLKRARHMVNVAADEHATPAERQSAAKRVRKELEGIIAVPTTALAELERQIAGAIESGSHRGGSGSAERPDERFDTGTR